MRIAVLMTCFNRRNKTVNCLETLYSQTGNWDIDIFLCDDGSTDGTAETVMNKFPKVQIIKGENLFWNRGMLSVMKIAIKGKYDCYLMINDDVRFYDTMLQTMLSIDRNFNNGLFALVGSTCNKSGKITYGGRKITDKPLQYSDLIQPSKNIKECDVANWNCFLLTSDTIEKIGLLDRNFEHGFGDYDYCYRLRRMGIPILVAPDYVGECETNNKVNPLNNKKVSRYKRIKILFSPKGIPLKSWYIYTKRYGGRMWLKMFLGTYLNTCLKIILNKPIN